MIIDKIKRFIKHLIRLWNTEKLLWDLRVSEREFKAGRYKKLNSFRDLM